MKHLKTYDDLINESIFDFGFLKGVKDFVSNFFSGKANAKEITINLTNALRNYQKEVLHNPYKLDRLSINSMLKKIKDIVGEELLIDLNLDSFFRGLYSVSVLKGDRHENIIDYFNSYIDLLSQRVQKLYKKKKDVDYEEEEFEEVKKLKKKAIQKMTNKEFRKKKTPLQIELLKLQNWLYRKDKRLAVLFEGRDAAGKGSAIKTIIEFLDPKLFKVATFGIPTEEEKLNWFERYTKKLPKPGKISFFDRSWYNRAVNDPVMGYCTKEQYNEFIEEVIPFEDQLIDNGLYLFKFWFSVSQETQELRFQIRQANPLKTWKFSENDLLTMNKWDKFTAYKERMFLQTSTEKSPWVIVDSNDKKLAQINIMKYILEQIPYKNKDVKRVGHPLPEIVIPLK